MCVFGHRSDIVLDVWLKHYFALLGNQVINKASLSSHIAVSQSWSSGRVDVWKISQWQFDVCLWRYWHSVTQTLKGHKLSSANLLARRHRGKKLILDFDLVSELQVIYWSVDYLSNWQNVHCNSLEAQVDVFRKLVGLINSSIAKDVQCIIIEIFEKLKVAVFLYKWKAINRLTFRQSSNHSVISAALLGFCVTWLQPPTGIKFLTADTQVMWRSRCSVCTACQLESHAWYVRSCVLAWELGCVVRVLSWTAPCLRNPGGLPPVLHKCHVDIDGGEKVKRRGTEHAGRQPFSGHDCLVTGRFSLNPSCHCCLWVRRSCCDEWRWKERP